MDPIRSVERVLAAFLRRLSSMSNRLDAMDVRRVKRSQEFWNDSSRSDLEALMHWRGFGPFEDDELWLSLGTRHMGMLERASEWADVVLPVDAIVEWGCGGGMNAVALARRASTYFAVDVSKRSLDECVRQAEASGAANCVPVRIEADDPESVLRTIPVPCDIFLSTYVFELLPSPAYGLRIMRVAHDLLRPGGVAFVQVRYRTGAYSPADARLEYEDSWVHSASYTIDGFWKATEEIGFEPLYVTLVPEQPELNESRYAYFALKR